MFQKILFNRHPKKVKAVCADDLEAYLQNLGFYDDFVSGSISCAICKKPLNINQIGAILPKNNEIIFCCPEDNCYRILLEEIE